MNDDISLPTTELLLALREMARQWHDQGRQLQQPGRLPPSNSSIVAPIVNCIEVTSSTADAYGYPARVQTFDTSVWADTYAEVRAVQIGSTIAGRCWPRVSTRQGDSWQSPVGIMSTG